MGGWKGGGLLLVLAIPLVLYAAWQVKGVVRADMVVSDAPGDRGASKEQLTKDKEKATKWAGDTRKAATVVLQYRPAQAADLPADPDALKVVQASAERTKDLKDLDLFLARVQDPDFTGNLKEQYKAWKIEADRAVAAEREINEWLKRPVVVGSGPDAARAMAEIDGLIKEYHAQAPRFGNRARSAVWRVSARLLVITALTKKADEQYRVAVEVKLPLEAGNNKVTLARDTLRAVGEQITALDNDVRRTEEEKALLDAATRAAINDKGAVKGQCAAGEELLNLFARDDLLTSAAKGGEWLKAVAVQYRRTKDEKIKATLRDKVQEFCEAFLAPNALLDAQVTFRSELVPRKSLLVEYELSAGADRLLTPLTDSTDDLNEFNVKERHPGNKTVVRFGTKPGKPDDLEPTALSRAALLYNESRKKVTAGTTGSKWTAISVEELKKKCGDQKEYVNKLKFPAGAKVGSDPQMWARMEGLLEGMKSCSDLFE